MCGNGEQAEVLWQVLFVSAHVCLGAAVAYMPAVGFHLVAGPLLQASLHLAHAIATQGHGMPSIQTVYHHWAQHPVNPVPVAAL
jgi:hypothetical protein